MNKQNKKFIFLDFDGVLNTPEEAHRFELNEQLVQRVGNFCYQNSVSIIFSTAWRTNTSYDTPEKLKDLLLSYGMPEEVVCAGMTSDLSYLVPKNKGKQFKGSLQFPLRSYEVRDYIEKNKQVKNYVILDDLKQLFLDEKNLLITNPVTGVSKKDLEKVLKIFIESETQAQESSKFSKIKKVINNSKKK